MKRGETNFSFAQRKLPFIFSSSVVTIVSGTARPQKVEISNYPNKKKIEVKVGESRRLECVVRSAKPAASIVWYRGNVQIKGGDTVITPISIEGGE
ncbi:hypothetical protein K0M31_005440 [Melipona bicolor]|uniref:Ig-like domain-containing protein n=1 Tax=Melipona bicolor TaxID=60889 RepID=A0AA40FVA1_9HYME|nr:hypothetical protein K0M31_005440 [Melipona bicolor]